MIPLKFTTPQAIADAFKFRPKSRQLAGTRIGDLIALGKSIVLCPLCRPKFDPRRPGYVRSQLGIHRHAFVEGECDGCLNRTDQGELLVPKSFVDQIELPRRRIAA